MFRITVILCAIAGQVLSSPQPSTESRTTSHIQHTHPSFVQRNPSSLNQPHEIADSQLNSLNYPRPKNWTEQKKNRIDSGPGQVVEKHGQIVTGSQSRLNSQNLLRTSSNPQNFGQQPEDLSQQQPSVLGNYTQRTSENLQFDHEHQEHSEKLGFGQQHQDDDLTQQIDNTKQEVDDLSPRTKHKRAIRVFGKRTSSQPKPRPKSPPKPRPKTPKRTLKTTPKTTPKTTLETAPETTTLDTTPEKTTDKITLGNLYRGMTTLWKIYND